MAVLDPVKNFAKVTVSTGYDASSTSFFVGDKTILYVLADVFFVEAEVLS